jgi:UDPglucose 6-dehydrogenase
MTTMEERISVIGVGKLGLCTAVCLAGAGYRVTGVDNDPAYLERIKTQKEFSEPGLSELFEKTQSHLSLTTDIDIAVSESDVSFIIVPTPSKNDGSFSNDYIESVFMSMAPSLKIKKTRHLINVVSTVMPEAYSLTFKPMIEKLTGKIIGKDIGYTYNPEFIALGSIIENFLKPDFVMIGESDRLSGDILENIYRKTCKNHPPISRTTVVNAEIAKLSLNCFCTMKISFANQISELCDHVENANAREVCAIIGQDRRIGNMCLMPGLGFGGPCFPRDNEAFVRFSREKNPAYGDLQRSVVGINNRQVDRAVKKILKQSKEKGKNVSLLGLSYKPGTPVTERSQALAIACELSVKKEINLKVHDPMARGEEGLVHASSIEECVKDADVVVILTPWPEFLAEEWRTFMSEGCVVMDLWR